MGERDFDLEDLLFNTTFELLAGVSVTLSCINEKKSLAIVVLSCPLFCLPRRAHCLVVPMVASVGTGGRTATWEDDDAGAADGAAAAAGAGGGGAGPRYFALQSFNALLCATACCCSFAISISFGLGVATLARSRKE